MAHTTFTMRRLRLLPETANASQIAFILGVRHSTVQYWIARGLPAGRSNPGNRWAVDRDNLIDWLRARHKLRY